MSCFKIVQIKKTNGGLELAAVPSAWESNGTVKWPSKMTKSKIKNLMEDASSVPPVDSKDWTSHVCVLKRTNFATYTQASNEIAEMELNSDSDAMDATKMPPPSIPPNKRPIRRCANVAKPNADDLRNDFNSQVCTFAARVCVYLESFEF